MPNPPLPRVWIVDRTEGARLRQFGKGVGHLLTLGSLLGFFFEHGDVYAQRTVGVWHLFSCPSDAVALENTFVGSEHSSTLHDKNERG